MNWRDQLRKASFRGVPFFWASADTELGRRTARHDYPQRDDAYLEDMGKIPREFYLEMYVIGAEYMAARDRLAAAFEQAGPGTLVHPTLGTLSVVVSGRVRLRESTSEGGMARFTALFVLDGGNKQPIQSVDTAAAVTTQAAKVMEVTKANYLRTFSCANQPAFVQLSAITVLQGATAKIKSIMSTFPTTDIASAIFSEVKRFEGTIATTLLAPKNLADSISGLIIDALYMFSPAGRVAMAISAYNSTWIETSLSLSTPSRRQEAANLQATERLMKVSCLTEAATAATEADYSSYQDAAATRAQILTAMENATATMPDEVTAELVKLRTALILFFKGNAANLARIVVMQLPATLPALVVAHNLYGDAARADEIVSRNRLSHPGFVPGGVALEVVTNG